MAPACSPEQSFRGSCGAAAHHAPLPQHSCSCERWPEVNWRGWKEPDGVLGRPAAHVAPAAIFQVTLLGPEQVGAPAAILQGQSPCWKQHLHNCRAACCTSCSGLVCWQSVKAPAAAWGAAGCHQTAAAMCDAGRPIGSASLLESVQLAAEGHCRAAGQQTAPGATFSSSFC